MKPVSKVGCLNRSANRCALKHQLSEYHWNLKMTPDPQVSIPVSCITECVASIMSPGGGGQSDQNCDYQCEANGGCRVKYVGTADYSFIYISISIYLMYLTIYLSRYVGPSRPGQLSGSCFPQSFGGSCSGTPPECRDCIDVLNC